MGMIQEFKAFAMRGSVMDLAVGVIIGGAFNKIIDSTVTDLIMPFVSWILGGKVDYSNWFIVLGDNPNNISNLAAAKAAGLNVFAYGNFITILINFILLAWVVFLLVKLMNKLHIKEDKKPAAPAPTPEDIALLREIRDELKRKN
ncbi:MULTISPECIES: large conductance mechanosensitive channel protein MscL [unclassified Acinetobacter]|uniref:large conductance mechanosensitive channel protein MscL n=1 Tax=unclassified Acinetobacter TaxID=196816 RepID=UPI002934523A|nr:MULTISPECIES: large conductance mechanosensitive channel protein MscL [unclassified Acinetobacter]WOE33031.1 large conductance mechanosensitive channel protein MscL [Acinetobacter sp. SAAs470]WOE38509.1 large conductance mechanosensitive channel protein MscL [Acinetobacter sp. SAAs474]